MISLGFVSGYDCNSAPSNCIQEGSDLICIMNDGDVEDIDWGFFTGQQVGNRENLWLGCRTTGEVTRIFTKINNLDIYPKNAYVLYKLWVYDVQQPSLVSVLKVTEEWDESWPSNHGYRDMPEFIRPGINSSRVETLGSSLGKWIEWNISQLVNLWNSGNNNYGFVLEDSICPSGGAPEGRSFRASEYSEADKRPRLVFKDVCSDCVPITCEGRCGTISDGCNGELICGNCDEGYICQESYCVMLQPQGEAYWANMNNEVITEANKEDSVRMMVEDLEANTNINISIYKVGGNRVWWNPFTWGGGDSFVGSIDSTTWKISESGTLYFNVSVNGNEFRSNDLEVSNEVNNKRPTIRIIKPVDGAKFRVNNNMNFEVVVSDEDDELEMYWTINGERVREFGDCRDVNCNFTMSFSEQGTKEIVARVVEKDRGQSARNYSTIFIYDQGINKFALITKPTRGQVIEGVSLVDFEGSESYISKCDTSCESGKECYSVSDLECYDFPKPEPKSGQLVDYNMYFNWTFSDGYKKSGNWNNNYGEVVEFKKLFVSAGEHSARLKVGYNTQ